jgi:hypothetical protein
VSALIRLGSDGARAQMLSIDVFILSGTIKRGWKGMSQIK